MSYRAARSANDSGKRRDDEQQVEKLLRIVETTGEVWG
jgi:hypothetical protein